MRRKQDVVKGPRTDKTHVFKHALESVGKKKKLRFVDHEVTISHLIRTCRTIGLCHRSRSRCGELTILLLLLIIIIIMYIYHALVNALGAHMIHINLNMIFYTHVKHRLTKTTHTKQDTERQTPPSPPTHTKSTMNLNVFKCVRR